MYLDATLDAIHAALLVNPDCSALYQMLAIIAEGQGRLDEAIAWMDCAVRQSIDFGTHTLFAGELVAAGIHDDEARAAAMSDTRMKYGGVPRGGHG